MAHYKNITDIARYEQIAVDLAAKVANREYKEGTKLYGRSTLAGQYNVSPETIRRAVALLKTMGIVEVVAGRGIIVTNSQAAKLYLEKFKDRKALTQAQKEFSNLLEERRKLDLAIDKQIKKIMTFSSRLINILPKVEEIKLDAQSPLVGKTLAGVGFRTNTGATVLSIERNGEENFSPDIQMRLEPEDILVFIGPKGCKKRVEEFVDKLK